MRPLRIAVLTGSRADYGILRPVLEALSAADDFTLELIVTGMHLSHTLGHTIDHIVADGYPIRDVVDVLLSGDSPASALTSLGTAITLIGRTLHFDQPEALLIYGDRFEALAGAIAGSYMNVPTVHMHGGDQAAGYSLDDAHRHAITKFSHLHLPATKRHAARIARMGEDPRRIFVVGSPAIDSIRQGRYTPPAAVRERLHLPFDRARVLVIQHPVSLEHTDAGRQISATLAAVRAVAEPTLWIYPNADPGGAEMIRVLESAPNADWLVLQRSIASEDFLGAMAAADVIVGNSSSSLIEAPSFSLPAVNIGTRQLNRDRGNNVVDVGYVSDDIERAIRTRLERAGQGSARRQIANPYGDGHAAERTLSALRASLRDSASLMRKAWVP